MQKEKDIQKMIDKAISELCEKRDSCSLYGDFYTPQNIADFLAGLLASQNKSSPSLYDPCCGSGSLLLTADNVKKYRLFGQALDEKCWKIVKMNAALRNVEINLGNKVADTLREDLFPNVEFDCILANPPFNLPNWCNKDEIIDERWKFGVPPKANANCAWLQHIIYHLKEDGIAAVIMPNNSLTSCYTNERYIRSNILTAGIVEAIITLSPRLFYNTRIPCCVWVLNKARKSHGDVLLVDAQKLYLQSEERVADIDFKTVENIICEFRKNGRILTQSGAVVVSFEKIAENKFILSPNLYMQEGLSRKYFELMPVNVHEEIVKKWKECFGNSDIIQVIKSLNQELLTSAKWEKYSLVELFDISCGLMGSKPMFEKGDCPVVDTKTIIDNCIIPNRLNKFAKVGENTKQRLNIKYGDFLMNRTSESIEKLGYCSLAATDCDAVFNGFTKRLRSRWLNDVDIFYVLAYFCSSFYRKEIEKVSTVYTVKANLNDMQLERVNIYLPPDNIRQIISGIISHIANRMVQTDVTEERNRLRSLISLIGDYSISTPLLLKELHNKEDK